MLWSEIFNPKWINQKCYRWLMFDFIHSPAFHILCPFKYWCCTTWICNDWINKVTFLLNYRRFEIRTESNPKHFVLNQVSIRQLILHCVCVSFTVQTLTTAGIKRPKKISYKLQRFSNLQNSQYFFLKQNTTVLCLFELPLSLNGIWHLWSERAQQRTKRHVDFTDYIRAADMTTGLQIQYSII